jgi:FkbM family methyltransferase
VSQAIEMTLRLPPPVAVRLGESSLRLTGSAIDRSVVQPILRDRTYEPHVQVALLRTLRAGDAAVDVGANIGVHTVLMARLVGAAGKVYCYEASIENKAYLDRNLALNGCRNVVAEQVGVWDAAAELEFSFVEEVAGCSFFSPAGVRVGRQEKVLCRPLDDLLGPAEPRRLTLIKIDVEGAEMAVLRGARRRLARQRPVLLIEFNPTVAQRFFGSTVDDLYDLLDELQYAVSWLRPDAAEVPVRGHASLHAILAREKVEWIDAICRPREAPPISGHSEEDQTSR